MAAMLTLQPTDCLRQGGGVHASSAFRLPRQRGCAAAAAARNPSPPPCASKLARPPVSARRGRANGRARAGAPRKPQETRAMENVVILKRGELIAPEIIPALPVSTPAADPCGVAAAAPKAEPVAEAEQCIAQAENAAPAAAAEQCVTPVEIPQTAAATAASSTRRATATKARTGRFSFGGPSFVIHPPDPSELPIPAFLLNSRGRKSPLGCASTASASA
uniref:Uncharacterized protein n=1 Tax=Leersia perrieri TaxID=77586 RepID=A0A0D9XDR0_9ORYZ